eukprot:TRINITY_DN27151_c0_g1_i1.p1 TRINITY_DN27151_c0_g1~~TRINITY_DN27151_c0_g1_i1.p1  ORF type:complete len:538 (-),score=90.43 TRINITY_DN27151_c0_g1_i1:104-1717(-)
MSAAAKEIVPRFCVLGGNVSGLSTAFFLQRSFPHAHISVVEPSERLGGLIQSRKGPNSQVLEQGFHSSILVNKNGREALGLAKLLKLEEDVVSANIESSARRHLFHYGRIQYFPRSHHVLQYCPALLLEALWPRGSAEDESVHSFVSRRASKAIADRLADPVCRGQLAGDARLLSVRTCFPRLWYNERRFRSVFVGSALSTLVAYRQRSWLSLDLLDPLLQRVSAGGRSYTFRNGMESLVSALEEKLLHPSPGVRPVELLRNSKVAKLTASLESSSPAGMEAEVTLDCGRQLQADTVVSGLPPTELSELLRRSSLDVPDASDGKSLCELLSGVRHESVTVVNVGFSSDTLKAKRLKGAGYFVGSLEGEQPLLAMTWDSQLFPQLGNASQADGSSKNRKNPPVNTQLTLYLSASEKDGAGRSEESAAEVAKDIVRRHLGIEEEPSEIVVNIWPEAVPQYEVGHHASLKAINSTRLVHLPWLQVVGPGYFGARNVADEIIDARELTDSMAQRFSRFPGLVENETLEDSAHRFGGGFDID